MFADLKVYSNDVTFDLILIADLLLISFQVRFFYFTEFDLFYRFNYVNLKWN